MSRTAFISSQTLMTWKFWPRYCGKKQIDSGLARFVLLSWVHNILTTVMTNTVLRVHTTLNHCRSDKFIDFQTVYNQLAHNTKIWRTTNQYNLAKVTLVTPLGVNPMQTMFLLIGRCTYGQELWWNPWGDYTVVCTLSRLTDANARKPWDHSVEEHKPGTWDLKCERRSS